MGREIRLHFSPCHMQQGPDNSPAPPDRDAGQAAAPAAAQEAHEDGLRLVVNGVGRGDLPGSDGLGGPLQEGIAEDTAGLLQIHARLSGKKGHILGAGIKGEAAGGRQVLDKTLVLVGGTTQAVVEMGHSQIQGPFRGEVPHDMQQAGGIRPA